MSVNLMNIKRYDLSAECSKCSNITKDIQESDIGDWVLYDDAEDQLRLLYDLLAVIHRDGGQYQAKVGLTQAWHDAIITVTELFDK